MFSPGGVLFLMSHEMLLAWRNFRASGKGKHVRRIIFYTLMTALLGFGGYWVARVLSPLDTTPTPEMLGAAGVVFALLLSLMVSQSLMLITESLYQRGDLDLLLSSPVSPWRVIIVRMAAIALNVGLFYLILVGAVFVWLPFFDGWAWMSFAPSVLMLTVFATAVGLVVARLLFWLIGPRNTRVVAQILASAIGALFFVVSQLERLEADEDRAQSMQHLFAKLMPVFSDPGSVLSLPARAAFGVGYDGWIWFFTAIAAFAAAVWWYASRFVADAGAIAGLSGPRRRRVATGVRPIRGGVGRSLVRKEWRLLRRDPLLLSQILMQLFYFIPLLAVFGTRLGEGGADRFAVSGFSGGFVLLVTSVAASLAWLTVSAEDAPDLIASAPVQRTRVEYAKAFAAGAPAAVLLMIPAVGAAVIVDVMAGVWLLIGGVAAITSTCLIAIWYQAPGNRKEFRRRTRGSLLLNVGRIFVALGWITATGLAVRGWPLLALLPALIAAGVVLALHESRPKPA